jgi:hypothetical protein
MFGFQCHITVVVAGGVIGADGDGLLDGDDRFVEFAGGAQEEGVIGVEGGSFGLARMERRMKSRPRSSGRCGTE